MFSPHDHSSKPYDHQSHRQKCCRLAWSSRVLLIGAHCVRQYLKYVQGLHYQMGAERPFNLGHEANAPA